MEYPQSVVSAAWLIQHLHNANIRIFDATYHMPSTHRNACAEFPEKHLPYARFFDIDKIADATSDLPHMLPSAAMFAQAVEALGMTDSDFAIVYDTHGLMSAARLWWMFRVFGHERVAVLDGGLPNWLAAGGPVETGLPVLRQAAPGSFRSSFRAELVVGREAVLDAVTARSAAVIDARGAARFLGQVPEPRSGVRGGHIPGSVSLPYTELLDEHGCLRSLEELRSLFSRHDVLTSKHVIASCGSGVTACVLALGLAQLGRTDVAVYDGSWSEWGADARCPVEVG